MVSEKSPLAKRLPSQLRPSSVFVVPLLNKATLEPFLIQLTWMRDNTVWPGRVTLQGRVAFALRPACISRRDTAKRVGRDKGETESLYRSASNQGLQLQASVSGHRTSLSLNQPIQGHQLILQIPTKTWQLVLKFLKTSSPS